MVSLGQASPYNAAAMTHLPRSIPLHPMLARRIARNGYGIGAVSGDEVIAFRYTDEAASRGPLDPPPLAVADIGRTTITEIRCFGRPCTGYVSDGYLHLIPISDD
jgi:hypothetical protein